VRRICRGSEATARACLCSGGRVCAVLTAALAAPHAHAPARRAAPAWRRTCQSRSGGSPRRRSRCGGTRRHLGAQACVSSKRAPHARRCTSPPTRTRKHTPRAYTHARAHTQGNVEAMYSMGWACWSGEGVAKSTAEAAGWYERAGTRLIWSIQRERGGGGGRETEAEAREKERGGEREGGWPEVRFPFSIPKKIAGRPVAVFFWPVATSPGFCFADSAYCLRKSPFFYRPSAVAKNHRNACRNRLFVIGLLFPVLIWVVAQRQRITERPVATSQG